MTRFDESSHSDLYFALGERIAQRPWATILFWACVLLLSLPASRRAAAVLHSGGGFVPGSASQRVERTLESEFDSPFIYPVLVLFQSATHVVGDPQFKSAVALVGRRLPGPGSVVREVRSYLEVPHWTMTSRDGHVTVVLVGMRAASTEDVESKIPDLRRALDALQTEVSAIDPTMRMLVTSDTAFNSDIDQLSARDSTRSERRALPLVLLCLLLAFGALLAAGLPLAVGLLSTTVTGAAVYLLAHLWPLSILIQNVTSMVGLGTGIDYALVMVTRFREELRQGRPVPQAVALTLATSGRAVTASGLMVAVGMVSMFVCPLLDIRSMALGCILVVLVAVAVTLTLLPALLTLLGTAVEATRWRPRLIDSGAWTKWVNRVVDHPWVAVATGLALVTLLTYPALDMWTDMPNGRWIPRSAESRQGYEVLLGMGHAGLSTPISILVQAPGSMLTAPHLTALHTLVERLQRDARVESVQSLVSIDPALEMEEYAANYEDPSMLRSGAFKDAVEALLSRHRDVTLVNVVPSNGLDNDGLRALVEELRSQPPPAPDLTVTVGGYAGWMVDFRTTLRHYFPIMVGLVMLLTWLVLFHIFRSWLLPLKAILMNLMSVGTAFGVLVMVYQWGSLAALIGLREPPGRVLVAVPPMLFCIVFGLSMDYEVFLVSRIQEFWHSSGDNRFATVSGVASTGPMITSAALIMVSVFGCFALADMVIVSMLGLGLATAVAIDATLIRVALVPAFMMLLGRYNWLPGYTSHEGRTAV